MLTARIALFLYFLLSFIPAAQAALDLELTQGVAAAQPIAVVSFAGEANNVPGNTTLTQVIKNDLQNSGQFRVSTPGLLGQKPSQVEQVNFPYWRKQGVNDVVIGRVKSIGRSRYEVSFQLVNVYGKQSNSTNTVLLDETFRAQQSGLRQLAHHISDLIYQKLTGTRGIFNTKIAYVLVNREPDQVPHYTLTVADSDGFNPRPLLRSVEPIMSPSWSPNGKVLAYVSFEHQRAEVYLQDVATGSRQMVSAVPGINGAPSFSPDGRQLALVLSRTGNPKVYTFDLTKRKLREITFGYSIDTEPSWAPDGKSIIFTSNRGGTPQIYQYDFATSQVNRLTFDGNYNARASYLPGEQGIVMMHRQTGLFGIAKQDLATGQVRVLTEDGSDESPSVAPNGKMVIYATNAGGRGVLGVVSINGRIKIRLPAREGSVQEPAWSPYLTS